VRLVIPSAAAISHMNHWAFLAIAFLFCTLLAGAILLVIWIAINDGGFRRTR
jgi:hypothetical protein